MVVYCVQTLYKIDIKAYLRRDESDRSTQGFFFLYNFDQYNTNIKTTYELNIQSSATKKIIVIYDDKYT